MMISPEMFVAMYKDNKYKELLPVRDELIDDIRSFEKRHMTLKWMASTLRLRLSINVIKYLGKLCELVSEKYNKEYVLGGGEDSLHKMV